MFTNLRVMGSLLLDKLKKRLTDETGAVDVVAIVVLIGIVVILAIVFRDQIAQLLANLLGTINDNANSAVTESAQFNGGVTAN